MQLKITVEDLPKIWGRYIFQCDAGKNIDLTEAVKLTSSSNPGFWLAKRVHQFFLYSAWESSKPEEKSTVLCSDLFGNIWSTRKTKEEFVEWFNNYSIKGNERTVHEKDYTGTRYHRLLTSKELEVVFAKVKELNW